MPKDIQFTCPHCFKHVAKVLPENTELTAPFPVRCDFCYLMVTALDIDIHSNTQLQQRVAAKFKEIEPA